MIIKATTEAIVDTAQIQSRTVRAVIETAVANKRKDNLADMWITSEIRHKNLTTTITLKEVS